MASDDRYPTPLAKISPTGLPGLIVVLFVVFGFAGLFVSGRVASLLLWLVVGAVIAACGVAAYRRLRQQRSKS